MGRTNQIGHLRRLAHFRRSRSQADAAAPAPVDRTCTVAEAEARAAIALDDLTDAEYVARYETVYG